MLNSPAYAELNKRWKDTCRILLGGEVGELSDYAKWLYEGNGPRMVQKSEISGKEVVFVNPKYSKAARWVSFDEVDLEKRYPPLSINEIKDIDSLLQAVSDRVVYAGGIVLGNSKFVEESSIITDCFYVLHTERVAFSKYVAYSTRGGYSDNIFGCYGFGNNHFIVKSSAITDSTRIFAVSKGSYSSDCYFSHGVDNCMDCVFCFNVKSKRHAIGNLELPRDRYDELKKKLVGEMRERLMKDKRLPLVFEIAGKQAPDYSLLKKAMAEAGPFPEEKTDKSKIEKAFSETAGVVLGTSLSPIDRYSEWMSKKSAIGLEDEKSCISGKALIIPDYAWFLKFPRDRLITQQEADFAGERMRLSENEVGGLSFDASGVLLNKLAFFCPFWLAGSLANNIDSPLNLDSVDCYRGALYILSKLCAFCFSPRSCDHSFGCREGRHNSFCINSHYSTRVTRCFELDACNNCTGCYFCHNCENVYDSMFCFNVKNKRYAIGNVEVGRERFLGAKKILLDWVNGGLGERSGLDLDIYNLLEKVENKK